MRDILNDAEKAARESPEALAQKHSKPALPKRFYKQAMAGPVEAGGFGVLLDGRPVRTPAKSILAMPTEAGARLISEEFDAQTDVIDPAKMPVTRLANTAIDGVANDPQSVFEDILRFAASDLLFYRAGSPERLIELQAEAWDPVLDLIRDNYGAQFVLAEGVMHVEQPRTAIAAIGAALRPHEHPDALASIHSMTALMGSALLALSVANSHISADRAWSAAHVDEDWNISQWGEDSEAAKRRAFRHADMTAAVALLDAVREDSA
ncbi:MAG: ATP12 family chaperone protein [Rhizobiaceae bacterium]